MTPFSPMKSPSLAFPKDASRKYCKSCESMVSVRLSISVWFVANGVGLTMVLRIDVRNACCGGMSK